VLKHKELYAGEELGHNGPLVAGSTFFPIRCW